MCMVTELQIYTVYSCVKFHFVVSTEAETTFLKVTFAKIHNIGEVKINAPVNVTPHYP